MTHLELEATKVPFDGTSEEHLEIQVVRDGTPFKLKRGFSKQQLIEYVTENLWDLLGVGIKKMSVQFDWYEGEDNGN